MSMSERVIESASGALRLRVTIEAADLFAMTADDLAAFDAVRAALDRMAAGDAEPVIVTVDDSPPIVKVDDAVGDRLVASAVKASVARAANPPSRKLPCRFGCGESFTSKGIAAHERACQGRTQEPPPAAPEGDVADLDLAPLGGLEEAVRATGLTPNRLGAASRMFLRDALAAADLRAYLVAASDRTVSLARRECGLEDDDPTLGWLESFVAQYRAANPIAA